MERNGRFCGVFRQVEKYVPKDSKAIKEEQYLKSLSRDEIRKLEDDKKKADAKLRQCINWGCTKDFKEEANTHKSCRAHTGRWDFGNSNDDNTEEMWPPHWTCCRKDWDEKGCTRTKHRGPFMETF